jgi:hypothetical protein
MQVRHNSLIFFVDDKMCYFYYPDEGLHGKNIVLLPKQ